MLRWPSHTKWGRYDNLVSTVDLAPTMLSACGVKPPREMGLNLLPVAAGKERLSRKAVFGEIFLHTSVDLQKPSLNLTHRWVREGDWKLIVPNASPPELYNLKADPSEEKNLASTQPERARHLSQALDAWWRGQ